MNGAKRTGKQERKTITQADIMERMRECWELLRLDGKPLKKEIENKLDYNFTLINLYIKLTEDEESKGERLFACGFEYEEEEDEENEKNENED